MRRARRTGHRARRNVPSAGQYVVTAIGIDGPLQAVVGDVLTYVATALMRAPTVVEIPNDQVVTGVTFTWDTADHGLATVVNGEVTFLAAGIVTLSATARGVTRTVDIAVTVAAPVVASVTVDLPSVDLVVGSQPVQATATAFDANGLVVVGQTFTWASTNAAKATVDSAGLVTAVAAGAASIQATTASITGSVAVTVTTPLPTLSSLVVSPDGATIPTSSSQQFTVLGTYSDGSTAVPTGVVWTEAGGGSIGASSGLYQAGASAETATVTATVGAVSDSATVHVVVAGVFPSQFDPARLGSDKLKGTRFSVCTIGDTLANLRAAWSAEGQAGFSSYPPAGGGGLSGNNLTTGQVTCVADPVWGQVMRVCFPGPSKQGVMPNFAQVGMTLTTATADWWYSCIFRHKGNGCVNGFAPPGYPNATLYPDGYYTPWGSGVPGGSTTHKHMFAFPTPTDGSRFEMVIMNGGYLNIGNRHGNDGATETVWSSKGTAGANDTLVSGATSFPYTGTNPLNTFRGDLNYYQWVARHKQVTATTYYQAYYFRCLTSNAGTQLLATPGPWRFTGWNNTGGNSKVYNVFQPLGNKSQSNDGPNDMYIDIAAMEVVTGTTTAEPYATLDGFGNHL